MPDPEYFRSLRGRDVSLELTPAGGGGRVTGRVVGTLDAADGLVIVLDPAGGDRRVTLNYQHVASVVQEPA